MGKVYISGQISGLPIEEVKEKFSSVEAQLIAQGYEVVNPLKNGLPWNAPWELHIAMDIVLLMGCDTIYLLTGWDNSRGATLEKNFAELTKKKIIYEAAPAYSEIKQAITEVMGVSFADITGSCKELQLVYARKIFTQLTREAGLTVQAIGKLIQRSHATVIYYLRTYENDYNYTPEFRSIANKVKDYLKKLNTPNSVL
ncbi:MAG: DUF4406 domain-containing protein [Clostridia bacterium]|nr:DUF4406 domain-containing protein [Clostridia bacterium]